MRNVLILIVGMLLSSAVLGQGTKGVIQLKGGSKLKGMVTRTADQGSILIKVAEIDDPISVPFESIVWLKTKQVKYIELPAKRNGYFNLTHGGLIFSKAGEFDAVEPSWTIHTINGYRFHEKIQVGLGLGLDRYGGVSALPIYVNGSYDVLSSRTTPVVNLAVGGAPMWEAKRYDDFLTYEDVKGGVYYGMGLGIKINYVNSALVFMMNYKNQQGSMRVVDEWWWGGGPSQSVENRQFRNLSLTVGLEF